MIREQWTHAQLLEFVAPAGKRSGYPSLFMRFQQELTEAIRSHTFLVPGCCWRPYQLAEWEPQSTVFAALARLCTPLSGIKYPDVYPTADGLVVELYYYTPTKRSPIDLTRTLEVIHTLQALGVSVDVLGWRRGR